MCGSIVVNGSKKCGFMVSSSFKGCEVVFYNKGVKMKRDIIGV
jgi:hypothetical protein